MGGCGALTEDRLFATIDDMFIATTTTDKMLGKETDGKSKREVSQESRHVRLATILKMKRQTSVGGVGSSNSREAGWLSVLEDKFPFRHFLGTVLTSHAHTIRAVLLSQQIKHIIRKR